MPTYQICARQRNGDHTINSKGVTVIKRRQHKTESCRQEERETDLIVVKENTVVLIILWSFVHRKKLIRFT